MGDNNFKELLSEMLGGHTLDRDKKAKLALLRQLNSLLEDSADSRDSSKGVPRKPQQKVIRDSFTFPENDYQLMQSLLERAMDFRIRATKGEILRAALHALHGMSDEEFLRALKSVEKLKPGRRKESD